MSKIFNVGSFTDVKSKKIYKQKVINMGIRRVICTKCKHLAIRDGLTVDYYYCLKKKKTITVPQFGHYCDSFEPL